MLNPDQESLFLLTCDLTGNIPELTLTEFGEIESKWQAQYGNVVRIKASLGVHDLL